ncbi:MAG: GntR family transcriptional regulator [Oscillospiraceae bacterium]|nr:GntR family transcriptional regulator [Oscillospiraceae bacterium]
MVHLDYRDARPIYSQIVDGFRDQILCGVLTPGDKMPSVRELATELTINPNTIQRAYRELEMQGWIVSVPGKGSFVGSAPTPSEAESRGLLDEFDKLTDALTKLGISRQELIQRISEGGNRNA